MSRDSNFEEQQSVSTDNENTTHKEVSKVSSSSTDLRKTWLPMPSPRPARNPIWQWIVTWILFLGLAVIVVVNNAGYRFPFLDAILPSATDTPATEAPINDPPVTESHSTEQPTDAPVPSPTDTPIPTVTPVPGPACSSVSLNLNFFSSDFRTIYFKLPENVCVRLEKTGEKQTGQENATYIEVKMWVWVKNELLSDNNELIFTEQGQVFLERPNIDPYLILKPLVDAKPLSVSVTGNVEGEYTEIIVVGFINEYYLKSPTPIPVPTQ